MDYSEYGEALHEITVFLPRQSGVEENPYPAVTPLQWQNSFDDAQTLCWFTETRRLSLSMITPDRWLPVLPECSWQESVSLTGNEMNGNTIFSGEILQAKDNPLAGKPGHCWRGRKSVISRTAQRLIIRPVLRAGTGGI